MIINHNIPANKAHRFYNINVKNLDKSFEVLSSGERINRAADDPAGLAVSEKMRAQIKGLRQAARNVQDGISFIQTADGYLKESNNILHRMRELTVQAANGTYTAEDRAQITVEFDQMVRELNRIHEDAKFNTIRMFDGYSLGMNSFGQKEGEVATGEAVGGVVRAQNIAAARNPNFNVDENTGKNGVVIQSGANTDERIFIEMDSFSSYTLGLTGQPEQTYGEISGVDNNNPAYRELSFFNSEDQPLEELMYLENSIPPSAYETESGQELSIQYFTPKEGTRIDLSTPDRATETITVLDIALNKVNKQRANIGASQNRLETTLRGINLAHENLQASESRIRDADMAKQYVGMTKHSILAQSSASMLAQANNVSNLVLRIIG
jgi:flagellin